MGFGGEVVFAKKKALNESQGPKIVANLKKDTLQTSNRLVFKQNGQCTRKSARVRDDVLGKVKRQCSL